MRARDELYFTLIIVAIQEAVKCEETRKAPCCLEVHGWSPWGTWSACSKTCGKGYESRSRVCHEGAGVACPGHDYLKRLCNPQPCPPVNGKWSPWENWGDCSVTCGGGSQKRMRTCTSPPPSSGGSQCSGSNEEKQKCNSNGCPVDGGWGTWSKWSKCSASCGKGWRFRFRSCNNPPTVNGGAPCRGEYIEIPICNRRHC